MSKWGEANQILAKAAGRAFWDFEEDLQKVIWQRLREKPRDEAMQLMEALYGNPSAHQPPPKEMFQWWLNAPSLGFLYSPDRPSIHYYDPQTQREEMYQLGVPTREWMGGQTFSRELENYYIRNVKTEITLDQLVSQFFSDWESGKYPSGPRAE